MCNMYYFYFRKYGMTKTYEEVVIEKTLNNRVRNLLVF